MSSFPEITYPDPLPPLMDATDLRGLLGLTGAASPTDDQITFASEVASSVIRNYVGRALVFESYVDTFYDASPSQPISLSEYPVKEITDMTVGGVTHPGADFKIHRKTGMTFAPSSFTTGDPLVVTYDAGYAPIPFDLQAVMLDLVRAQLQSMGLPSGTITGEQPIKAVSVGALKVEYAIASNSTATKGVQSAALASVVEAYAETLNPYRHSRILAAMA